MLFSFDAGVAQFAVHSKSATSQSGKSCSAVKKKAGLGFHFYATKVNRNYSSTSPCLEFFLVTSDARGLLSNIPKECLPSFLHLNE